GHITVRVPHIVSSGFDDFLQGGQKTIGLGVFLSPTAVRALVASGPHWVYTDQKGIAVTIHLEVPKFQEIATLLPLGPQPLFAAAVKGHLSAPLGLFQGRLVHIAQHEHIVGPFVLYDRGYQAIRVFGKIYVQWVFHVFVFLWAFRPYWILMGIPAPLRVSFRVP